MRRALTLLCLLATAPTGGGRIDLSAPAGYTSTLRTYPVRGETPSEVDASLKSNGPQDESGVRRFAVTQWNLTWKWKLDRHGAPDLDHLEIRGNVDVLMPRLEGARHLLPAWNRWIITMLRHERNHVAHLRGSVDQLRGTLAAAAGLTALELNQRGQAIVGQLRHRDHVYDRVTRNGWAEGVRSFSDQEM
jgi:predicted secreted Zn-dependent protease